MPDPTSKLVECVPNFSEGRNREKVEAIVAAMSLPGVYVLDLEMDSDHNRSVVTLAAHPDYIVEAIVRGVGKAAELINLTNHQGAHPRMGATDVIPFVPVAGVTLADCVELARSAAAEIWKRYGIPVYMYEAAATHPERQNLENVRKGQFEGLRDEILTNPGRAPDYGEPRIHPTAGAVAVGARKFLIAYNVFLNTQDVEIARKIAKSVRFSSGGLRYVKGMGIICRGMAQVSMNLTDFEQTSIARVFEFVKREAARYGAAPVSSEIVGLIPKKALEQAAEWFLQVENFDSSLIFENRLAAIAAGGSPPAGGLRSGIEPYLDQLALPTPTPGGGSASAAAGAMAAALAQMVAGTSRGKKNYLQFDAELNQALVSLTAFAEKLRGAIAADAKAFAAVMEAHQEAKKGAAGGQQRVQEALKTATLIPLGVAQHSREVAAIAASLRPITNPNMSSDLTVALALARAAVDGALANVEINLAELSDKGFVAEVHSKVAGFKKG